MNKRLSHSITGLYEVFKKYQSGPTMEGSSLYRNEIDQWNRNLFSMPLEKLNEDELSRYAAKAITTWGDVTDYKHFLPRILELTAQYQTPYEVWIVFEKIHRADWGSWDIQEYDAIKNYMDALWESILEDDSSAAAINFEDYFSTLAHFHPDFGQLISVWEKSDCKASVKHFANFIVNQHKILFDRGKLSGFQDKTENCVQLTEWILTSQKLEFINQKFFEYEAEDFADKISLAEIIIRLELNQRNQTNSLT